MLKFWSRHIYPCRLEKLGASFSGLFHPNNILGIRPTTSVTAVAKNQRSRSLMMWVGLKHWQKTDGSSELNYGWNSIVLTSLASVKRLLLDEILKHLLMKGFDYWYEPCTACSIILPTKCMIHGDYPVDQWHWIIRKARTTHTVAIAFFKYEFIHHHPTTMIAW